MKAATLFSGVGAPELAMPEWDWIWHAEIEKFPAAVMAARFPHSVNLGDVTADDFCDRALAIGRPDVLVFGSPCQSYSVAGKRLGLDDPRGNLALVALGIVARIEPAWFVFENVPGLLSSGNGRDFGLFLRAVDECGYSLAWSVLDAQYFGLAQRRKRVFAVGNTQDWRGPAAVLLEPESLCGHPPTREEARESPTCSVAPCIDASGCGFARTGDNRGQDPVVAVTHALRADGYASEDGTGRGTPLVPVHALAPCLTGNYGKQPDNSDTSAGPMLVPVAFGFANTAGETQLGHTEEQVPPITTRNGDPGNVYTNTTGVRRLMPVECERLQGMPDGHTAVLYNRKPATDGPRYKAIGNSMAVPVVRWILTRLQFVHDVQLKKAGAA